MIKIGSKIAVLVLLAWGVNAAAEESGPPETIWQYDTGG